MYLHTMSFSSKVSTSRCLSVASREFQYLKYINYVRSKIYADTRHTISRLTTMYKNNLQDFFSAFHGILKSLSDSSTVQTMLC